VRGSRLTGNDCPRVAKYTPVGTRVHITAQNEDDFVRVKRCLRIRAA
jgi:hypothetical protein